MERLTKRSYDTTKENGVCCTHFHSPECFMVCLLYTSDAADDAFRV